MAAKNTPVRSPLQLLQQLSISLVEHLEKACAQAREEAEDTLAKLEKQRAKAQDKQLKAQARRDEAVKVGKPKAEAKARATLEELEGLLGLLQARQAETLTYLSQLSRDADASLKLAAGIRDVGDAAGRALQGEQPGAVSTKAAKRSAAASAPVPKRANGKAEEPAEKTTTKTPSPASAAKAASTPKGNGKAASAPSKPAPKGTAKPAAAAKNATARANGTAKPADAAARAAQASDSDAPPKPASARKSARKATGTKGTGSTATAG